MGRSQLDLIVPLSVALCAWLGCTSISGLDDLAFDLAPGAGAAAGQGGSTSGGGGTGAGAAGGSAAPCADSIDVAGVTIETGGEGSVSAPTIAAGKYGRVGSLWKVDPEVVEIIVTDLGGGQLLDDGIAQQANATYQPTVAANETHFAIAYPQLNDFRMRFYVQQTAVQEPGTLGVPLLISQTGAPRQAHVVAGADGGFLVSAARADGGDFFHGVATRSAGDWTVAAVAPFSSSPVCCCGSRNWAATGGDQYHVASSPSDCTHTSWALEILDLDGVSTSVGQIANTSGAPEFGLRLGDEVIFANCGLLVRLDTAGNELGRITLPGTGSGGCTIASSGTELRWIVNQGNAMQWHALDPVDGVGDLLLTLELTTGSVPAATWDGSGFPVMWALNGKAAFARIACD